jgi:hypothetical protein
MRMGAKILAITLSAIVLSSCSVLVGSGNTVIVDIATRQAVFRYIDAGETEKDKDKRAGRVVDAVRVLDSFLGGNPTADTSTLLSVLEGHVKWDRLSAQDKFLVKDIIGLIRLSLERKQREGLLDPETVIVIRQLLNTAKTAAMLL